MSKSALVSLFRAGIGALAIGAVCNVHAADNIKVLTLNTAALHAAVAARQVHASAARQRAQAVTIAASALSGGYANPYRAYPPSCLADGLPAFTAGSDPNARQTTLTLAGYDDSGNPVSETDTFTLWRVPCSGGVSATLLEIDRPSVSDSFMFFPSIVLTNASNVQYPPRLPQDPNTVYSDTPPAGELSFSSVYAFDYFYGDSTADAPDFNQAFTLSIDTLTQDSGGNEIIGTLGVPAYSPATFNNYPSASNPLEISGYVSGPWYDSTHSGEGMLIEVYDNGDHATRTFAATWYTFDNLGLPFWLVTSAKIPIQGTAAGVSNGYQIINAPVQYVTGGGFAGNFTPPVTRNAWGTMSFSFPGCNTLNFSYNGATGSNINNGPSGNSTRLWTRLANINGVVCQ
ncbi:MAG: hypothetical protein ACREPT_07140 [Rudaea sp.]